MMTAAALTAVASLTQIFGGWHAPEFKRLGHVLIDRRMHLMHFLLRIHEAARDRIAQQLFPLFFELGNFLAGQGLRALLLLLKRLAFGHQVFVLSAGFLVRDKRLNPLTRRPHAGLIQNRLAKLSGLLSDHIFLSCSFHKKFFAEMPGYGRISALNTSHSSGEINSMFGSVFCGLRGTVPRSGDRRDPWPQTS